MIMKWFVVLVMIINNLVYAEEIEQKNGVLKRTTRQTLNSLSDAYVHQLEKIIALNCRKNGLSSDGASKLQKTFDEMIQCLSATRIFSVSKSEYISQMVNCSKDAYTQTEACLSSDQKYFPKFSLDYAKSLVNLLYDDKSVLASMDVQFCFKKFATREVLLNYIGCISTVAVETNDTEIIPSSKSDFCGKFLPESLCLPKTLKLNCDNTTSTTQFSNDYTSAMEQAWYMLKMLNLKEETIVVSDYILVYQITHCVFKRSTRVYFQSLSENIIRQTEAMIILNCENNGLSHEGAFRLQSSFNELKRCLATTRMFSVSKSEYINILVNCSKDAYSLTEACLAPDQKYFPKFALDYAKAMVNLVYDDKNVLASMDFQFCFGKFADDENLLFYVACLNGVAIKTNDTDIIPNSRADLCGKFLPATLCLPKTIRHTCLITHNTAKFNNDYITAMEQLCKSE